MEKNIYIVRVRECESASPGPPVRARVLSTPVTNIANRIKINPRWRAVRFLDRYLKICNGLLYIVFEYISNEKNQIFVAISL